MASSVIYYWTDARQHSIYLFYIITKQTTTNKISKYFKKNAKSGLCPLWWTRKSYLMYSIIYTKRNNLIVIVPGKSCHCQTWLERRSSWNQNLQRKKNWTAKSTNLKGNAKKVKSLFVIRAALSLKYWLVLLHYQSGPWPEMDIWFPVLWLAHAKPRHCPDRERTKTERNGERKEIYVGGEVAKQTTAIIYGGILLIY